MQGIVSYCKPACRLGMQNLFETKYITLLNLHTVPVIKMVHILLHSMQFARLLDTYQERAQMETEIGRKRYSPVQYAQSGTAQAAI